VDDCVRLGRKKSCEFLFTCENLGTELAWTVEVRRACQAAPIELQTMT
jgi:hypothetical protein